MILIITNKEDVTTDFIVDKLNKRKALYFRLNTEDISNRIAVNFDFDRHIFTLYDMHKRIEVNLDNIGAVYFRRPKIPGTDNEKLSNAENIFLSQEFSFLLEGMYRLLGNCYWINNVYDIRKAENKIYQQVLAKEIGFDTPYSLITNDPQSFNNFIDRHNKDCIIKPIKSGLIDDESNPRIIFTSKVKLKDKEQLARVSACPVYIQNKVSKISDLRVTVVGENVFAARILSQENPDSMIDWRKGKSELLIYEKCHLPNHVVEKCVNLTRCLNLTFSAIDLIETQNGNFIFLEINPNGQWAWIENRLGYNISGTISNFLVCNDK